MNLRSLFLENVSIKQTVAKNIFWLIFAEAVNRLLRFFLVVFAAGTLGVGEYGKFSFALSFAALFGIFSDFGLSTIATREVAKDRDQKNLCDSILSLKFLLSFITLGILFAASFFVTDNQFIQRILFVTSFVTIFDRFIDILVAFFRAHQKMEYEALAKIVQAVLTIIFGFLILFRAPNALSFSYAYFFAGLVTLLLMIFIYNYRIQSFRLNWNRAVWKEILKNSWPIGASAVFASIYSNLDSVIMGKMNQIEAVGYYEAAYKLALIILVPYGLVYQSFFPLFSYSWGNSKDNLARIFSKYNELLMGIIVPIVFGSVVLGDKIIGFVYHSAYFPSALAFKILVFSMLCVYLSSVWSAVLIISNNQKKYLYVNIFGAIFNAVLNIILIPKYSIYGAATSIVSAQFLMSLLLYFYSNNLLKVKVFRFFVIPIISSFIMYLSIKTPFIYNNHIMFIILSGAFVYLSVFAVIRYIINVVYSESKKIISS